MYAVPDERVGDQVMAAIVLNEGATLTPKRFEDSWRRSPTCPEGMAALSRINTATQTATNKVLKRTLIAARADKLVEAGGRNGG